MTLYLKIKTFVAKYTWKLKIHTIGNNTGKLGINPTQNVVQHLFHFHPVKYARICWSMLLTQQLGSLLGTSDLFVFSVIVLAVVTSLPFYSAPLVGSSPANASTCSGCALSSSFLDGRWVSEHPSVDLSSLAAGSKKYTSFSILSNIYIFSNLLITSLKLLPTCWHMSLNHHRRHP